MRSVFGILSASCIFAGVLTIFAAGSAFAGDTWDKEATEIALKRAARQVKEHCGAAKDSNGKATGPWGATRVTVTLGHNGHSKGATVPPPFDGEPTGKCAVQAFSNLTYPPWAGADVVVEWDVEIVQQGGESGKR